jgi:hypothetical protein
MPPEGRLDPALLAEVRYMTEGLTQQPQELSRIISARLLIERRVKIIQETLRVYPL